MLPAAAAGNPFPCIGRDVQLGQLPGIGCNLPNNGGVKDKSLQLIGNQRDIAGIADNRIEGKSMDTFKNIGRMPAGRNRDVNTLLPQLLQQRPGRKLQHERSCLYRQA